MHSQGQQEDDCVRRCGRGRGAIFLHGEFCMSPTIAIAIAHIFCARSRSSRSSRSNRKTLATRRFLIRCRWTRRRNRFRASLSPCSTPPCWDSSGLPGWQARLSAAPCQVRDRSKSRVLVAPLTCASQSSPRPRSSRHTERQLSRRRALRTRACRRRRSAPPRPWSTSTTPSWSCPTPAT